MQLPSYSSSSSFLQATLLTHFSNGAFYPLGGASEIAFHMIPTIERAGGKVLVRANVTSILTSNAKVTGVRVSRVSERSGASKRMRERGHGGNSVYRYEYELKAAISHEV